MYCYVLFKYSEAKTIQELRHSQKHTQQYECILQIIETWVLTLTFWFAGSCPSRISSLVCWPHRYSTSLFALRLICAIRYEILGAYNLPFSISTALYAINLCMYISWPSSKAQIKLLTWGYLQFLSHRFCCLTRDLFWDIFTHQGVVDKETTPSFLATNMSLKSDTKMYTSSS